MLNKASALSFSPRRGEGRRPAPFWRVRGAARPRRFGPGAFCRPPRAAAWVGMDAWTSVLPRSRPEGGAFGMSSWVAPLAPRIQLLQESLRVTKQNTPQPIRTGCEQRLATPQLVPPLPCPPKPGLDLGGQGSAMTASTVSASLATASAMSAVQTVYSQYQGYAQAMEYGEADPSAVPLPLAGRVRP